MKYIFETVLALVLLTFVAFALPKGDLHASEDDFDPAADADNGTRISEDASLLPQEEIEAGTRDDLEYGDSMYEDWGSDLPDEDGYDLDKIENPQKP